MNRLLVSTATSTNSRRICAFVALSALTTTASAFHLPLTATRRMVSSLSCSAGGLTIVQVPALSDNYGYLIHDEGSGQTAVVDTPEAGPYRQVLDERGWKLTHIFNTHHHHDHTGANQELKTDGVQVVGPANEKARIPGIDVPVGDGDVVQFGSTQAKVMDVGGHTKGHIAYHFPLEKTVFVGDSLFALGCGKMFEGTPGQFWTSLTKLRELDDDTKVYCAHEYTESNGKFAVSVEPNNPDLVARFEGVKDKRSRGEWTVPSTMGEEKKTNPFLRCDISEEIRSNVGVKDADSPADAFAKVRKAKDNFRG